MKTKIVRTLGAALVASFALASAASAVVYEQYPYEVGGELVAQERNSTRAEAPRIDTQDFDRGLYDAH